MAQEPTDSLKLEDIAGRWVEYQRIEGETVYQAGEFPDTYIFRETMIFHKGEAAEGVILFNIAGRYTLNADSITIYYQDYLQKNASKMKPKILVFKVLEQKEDEMTVLAIDYNYEYKMVLKKQIIE